MDLSRSVWSHGAFAVAVFAGVLFASLIALAYPLAFGFYFAVADHSSGLASLAALLGFGLGTAAAVLLAVKFASLLTAERLVRALGAGALILDFVFAQLLDTPPAGTPAPGSLAAQLHGLPLPEFRKQVESASRRVLAAGVAGKPPIRWLGGPLRRVLVWAILRVVVRNAACTGTSPLQLDVHLLRDNLARGVDEFVVGQLCASRFRVVVVVLAPTLAAAGILLAALRWAPVWGA